MSLTIDGYTFDNHPTSWEKRIDLPNSPERHHKRELPTVFQSKGYSATVQFVGALSLNESTDRTELSDIQQKQIDGQEIEFTFDPFFSGTGVIVGDPFNEGANRGTYSFTIEVNSEDTDASSYDAHATPSTGVSTFKFGDHDFGFDPDTVSQDYDRDTSNVPKITGQTQTVDSKGLITTVTLQGVTDGGGQKVLWDKAKSNALSYLNAEFQSGWALIRRLRINNDPSTPLVKGLYQYNIDFLIVRDATKGIVQPSKAVNKANERSGDYVSEDTVGTQVFTDGLDVTINEGTGAINGNYVAFPQTTVTLADNDTNYIYVTDSDGDGFGDVQVNQSGFPTDSIELWEKTTSGGSITSETDHRTFLIETTDTQGADLFLSDDIRIFEEQLTFFRSLFETDTVPLSGTQTFTGSASLSENVLSPADSGLLFTGLANLSDTVTIVDGGTASSSGEGGGGDETLTWETATDWNNAVSESGVAHESVTNADHGDTSVVLMGYTYGSTPIPGVSRVFHFPLHEDSGSTANDVTGNGNDGTIDGPTLGGTGILNSSSYLFDGSDDDVDIPDTIGDPSTNDGLTWVAWVKRGSTGDQHVSVHDLTNGAGANFGFKNDKAWIRVKAAGGPDAFSSNTLTDTSSWHLIGAKIHSNGDQYAALDGNPWNQGDNSGMSNADNAGFIGQAPDGTGRLDAELGEFVLFDDALTDTEWSNLYDVVDAESTLTTATKSFSALAQPDLQNLSYSLNSQSIVVEVIGSPSGGSETVSQTLDGASSYSLSWSDSHTDFRIKLKLSTTDPTASPTVNSIELTGVGGLDADQNPNTEWTIHGASHDKSGHEYEGGGVISEYAS